MFKTFKFWTDDHMKLWPMLTSHEKLIKTLVSTVWQRKHLFGLLDEDNVREKQAGKILFIGWTKIILERRGLTRNASIVLFPSQWLPWKPWGAIMSTCVCAISGGFYRELKIQPWLLWHSVSLAILASFVIKWIFQGSPEFTRIKSLLRDDQVDWPTQLTLVICVSWSMTNTSEKYERTLQGNLLLQIHVSVHLLNIWKFPKNIILWSDYKWRLIVSPNLERTCLMLQNSTLSGKHW